MPRVFAWIYQAVALATFVFLTFFDGYTYTAWNWLIAIPANAFMSAIWPLYWTLLRWVEVFMIRS
ncbi:hypothetical protein [Sphingomonas jatrophae]|uniref:DUF2798 domain-containing protein n=1 Tax=Sphingomonas jatrophae TaxID=1166337 RepID=A0A1I6K675_9SPHN|nr:hypothetical protein [Sphingomonas jatrophae]SFR86765.1 hypothetical protein SAMN05192580_1374 [Sphingomonas jatrophae]